MAMVQPFRNRWIFGFASETGRMRTDVDSGDCGVRDRNWKRAVTARVLAVSVDSAGRSKFIASSRFWPGFFAEKELVLRVEFVETEVLVCSHTFACSRSFFIAIRALPWDYGCIRWLAAHLQDWSFAAALFVFWRSAAVVRPLPNPSNVSATQSTLSPS